MAKKIPLRQCIGCGEQKSKKEMMRVLKTPENEERKTEEVRISVKKKSVF